jgi:hypothetical protein
LIYGVVSDADPSHNRIQAIPAVTEDSLFPFSVPAVDRKKITTAFDGGRITSDAGVVLLGQAERRRGLADKLAAVSADPRNPLLITPDPALLGDYGDPAWCEPSGRFRWARRWIAAE